MSEQQPTPAEVEKIVAAVEKPPLFDVVIYRIKGRIVDSIVGTNMERERGHYNAERRFETAMSRINDNYNVAIVPAGLAEVGKKLPKETD